MLVLTDQLIGHLEQEPPGHEIEVNIEHSVTTLTRMLGAEQYDAIIYGEVNDHDAAPRRCRGPRRHTQGAGLRTPVVRPPAGRTGPDPPG
ncbi:hypothetical protein ACH4ZU_00770 [Streptomyces sp. NPDC020472]|uniref:hypothetical protein n=1 Tax=Streptomyces sp. NPDC020472 TaxID=3365075 RepID=UPI0037AD8D12